MYWPHKDYVQVLADPTIHTVHSITYEFTFIFSFLHEFLCVCVFHVLLVKNITKLKTWLKIKLILPHLNWNHSVFYFSSSHSPPPPPPPPFFFFFFFFSVHFCSGLPWLVVGLVLKWLLDIWHPLYKVAYYTCTLRCDNNSEYRIFIVYEWHRNLPYNCMKDTSKIIQSIIIHEHKYA